MLESALLEILSFTSGSNNQCEEMKFKREFMDRLISALYLGFSIYKKNIGKVVVPLKLRPLCEMMCLSFVYQMSMAQDNRKGAVYHGNVQARQW
jgi:hypothetical protein